MRCFTKEIRVKGYTALLEGYVQNNPAKMSAYRDRRPAVIIFPGGAYSGLAAHEGEPVALKLAGEGICAFVLKYSVRASGAVFPQALAEALTAVRFVRENAAEFAIDPNAIATLGFSAGGHLCAATGVLWNHSCLDGYLEGDRTLYRPNKIVPCYPVISTDSTFANRGSFANLFQKPFEALTEEERTISSLERQVRTDSVPAFLWTTYEDTGVPPLNAVEFAAAMLRAHVPCELHMYPHGPHGIGLADHMGTLNCAYGHGLEAADWMRQVVRFLYDETIR